MPLANNRLFKTIFVGIFFTVSYAFLQIYFIKPVRFDENLKMIIGEGANLPAHWIGTKAVNRDTPILILAGHADSQGISGAGTLGEAVDRFGYKPMNPRISDELFWNLKLQESIVRLGKKRGLNISSYDPPLRNIDEASDPRTNWSVGKQFAIKGGYVIEIHFDAYGKYGLGAGLIPPLFVLPNKIDESLAKKFGRFPVLFRGGLGAPRRQIRILEIGKLEGSLEKNLRNIKTRQRTIKLLANEIVHAFLQGLI